MWLAVRLTERSMQREYCGKKKNTQREKKTKKLFKKFDACYFNNVFNQSIEKHAEIAQFKTKMA